MFQRNSEVFFIAVRRAVPIVEILRHYGIMSMMHRNGDNLIGTCPLHNGRGHEVTFHVIASKDCWNCLTPCKRGGDVINFVAIKENVSLFKAAILLSKWFGLRIDTGPDCPLSAGFVLPVGTHNPLKGHLRRQGHDVNSENTLLKTYVGMRHSHQTAVMVNGRPLNPRFDLWDYHPLEAFEWGYCGGGPSQLALALLADCIGNDRKACELCADFRRTVVEKLDCDDEWVLYDYQIRQFVRSLRLSST